jgi:hypothetical protein
VLVRRLIVQVFVMGGGDTELNALFHDVLAEGRSKSLHSSRGAASPLVRAVAQRAGDGACPGADQRVFTDPGPAIFASTRTRRYGPGGNSDQHDCCQEPHKPAYGLRIFCTMSRSPCTSPRTVT